MSIFGNIIVYMEKKNFNREIKKIEEKIGKEAKHDAKRVGDYAFSFVKWLLIAGITGVFSGVIGSLFRVCINYVTDVREQNTWLYFLLPFGGLLIALIYRATKLNGYADTNLIINSVRTDEKIPITLAPVIFVSTVITQLFGGSAGREGAALQLGGAIGAQIGRWFKLDLKDIHIAIMVGMSGLFAALFETPVTATLFAMEVISVGVIYYSAFIPCMVSSLVAVFVTHLFGLHEVMFEITEFPVVDVLNVLKVALIGVCCAIVSIVFCQLLKFSHKMAAKFFKNEYLRLFVGGVIVVVLTIIFGTRYGGTGIPVIAASVYGDKVFVYDFLLKILFTVITIGFGYKGGEIVPTFFIGATLGSVIGSLIGLNPGFAACVGLVALFCAVVNCPIASLILSIELFGATGLILFAVSICISYMLSGYFGLYTGQKIIYSKRRALFIDKNTK